jgi:hypothetical protein
VTTSCGSNTSPQHSYATEIGPALEPLAKSQRDYAGLEGLLLEELDATTGITRLQLIELYNIGVDEYQITRDEYSKLGFMPLDALVGPAVKFSKDGQSILDIMSVVTPVQGIQPEHQIVLECLQTRVAFADELATSIRELSSVDMTKAGDLASCELFEASLEKLTAFVDENK